MNGKRPGDVRFRLSFPFLVILTAGFLLDAALVGAILCGIAVHEAAHLLFLRAFRLPIYGIDCRLSGILIHSAHGRGSFWCELAGPLANLLTGAVLWNVWRMGAVASLVLGTIHLLPIPGTDGAALLRIFRPERRDKTAMLFCAGLFLTSAVLCACGRLHPLVPAALLARLFRRESG